MQGLVEEALKSGWLKLVEIGYTVNVNNHLETDIFSVSNWNPNNIICNSKILMQIVDSCCTFRSWGKAKIINFLLLSNKKPQSL